MLVEKCKRVMMEERRGRHRARRMAREVAGFAANPVGNVLGFAGNTVGSVAGEDMSGGAKVLLLLAVAGAVGGGIYYLTTKPAAAATPPATPVVNPNVTATAASALTNSQLANIAASLFGTTLSTLQLNGVTAAQRATLTPAALTALTAMGVRSV